MTKHEVVMIGLYLKVSVMAVFKYMRTCFAMVSNLPPGCRTRWSAAFECRYMYLSGITDSSCVWGSVYVEKAVLQYWGRRCFQPIHLVQILLDVLHSPLLLLLRQLVHMPNSTIILCCGGCSCTKCCYMCYCCSRGCISFLICECSFVTFETVKYW